MYKVYLIRDIHGLKYVGITQSTIKRRLQRHESDKSTGRYYSSSKLDLSCCKISILEDDITEENKKEKEQYWIDKIDCVNQRNAVFDRKEYDKKYREEHKENSKKYDKEHYEEHKEEIKENSKKYYEEHKEERKKYLEENKEQIKENSKKYREKNKEERKEYNKKYRDFQKSWGGDKRSNNNNLLSIDTTLFLN